MIKHFLLIILLFGFDGIAKADKTPVKFGSIDKAELINNVYAPDTSAPAVVLCDYGYFTANTFQMYRVLRIKILKKEGYFFADQTFGLNSKANIRGITYNLEGNNVVETRLKNESIYETRITDDKYEMRVAMPNVKVGSIIDIEFSYWGIPNEWDFQQAIPVVHSELIIEPSTYITYSKNFFGFIPLTLATDGHWKVENVPAFRSEPYLTSSKNYRTRIEFDVESLNFPGMHGYLTTSWNAVREVLFDYTYFGAVLASDGYIKAEAKDMQNSTTSQDDLIKMAYAYVKKIKWDKTERLVTEKTSLNNAYKEGKGNSAEINLALVQLLRKLDFNAGPVVMSTRENGRLSTFRPSLNKLNYVIAAVFLEKDTLLLDATEANCPYYLLPMRALNEQGQYMDKHGTAWIQIATNKKAKETALYDFTISNDLALNGKISYSKADYAALNFRNDYETFNSDEEYLTNFREKAKGLKIVSHTLTNLDSLYKPVVEKFEIKSNQAVNDIDGELYLMPLLFEQIKENPFKVDKREYPIDFGYATEKTIIVNYVYPAGYTVASMPTSANMKLPGNSASFSCIASSDSGKISIIYKFNINKSLFPQTEYADLRAFYNQVIAKEAELVVFKKL